MNHMNRPPDRLLVEEASTADLVRDALDEAKELMRVEIELARSEVDKEIARAKRAAVGFGVALAAGVVVLSLLAVALLLALGGTAPIALMLATAILLIGVGAAFAGYELLPKKPLDRTRRRLKAEVGQLREHVA